MVIESCRTVFYAVMLCCSFAVRLVGRRVRMQNKMAAETKPGLYYSFAGYPTKIKGVN